MIRTLDLPRGDEPPTAGDLLATPRRLYRIEHVEPVETRIRCDRWRLDCRKIAARTRDRDPWSPPLDTATMADGARYHVSVPYRGEPPSVVWGVDR